MSHSSPRPAGAGLLAAAALAGSLSACAPDRAVTGSLYPTDSRQRHPIVLAEGSRRLDVFATAAFGIDPRQHADVKAFAEEFRRFGHGGILAQIPDGGRGDPGAHRTLDAVRAALEAGGFPGAYLAVATYIPADPTIAAPIRLSFRRLQAKVASKCGLWPQDLGVGDAGFNARNEPYWNLGCATQSNVAAQVADPVDLVRARTEGRIDSIRRSKDIDNLRQGKDPSTQYRQDDKGKISQAVGN